MNGLNIRIIRRMSQDVYNYVIEYQMLWTILQFLSNQFNPNSWWFHYDILFWHELSYARLGKVLKLMPACSRAEISLKSHFVQNSLHRKKPSKLHHQTNFHGKISMNSTLIVKVPFLEHQWWYQFKNHSSSHSVIRHPLYFIRVRNRFPDQQYVIVKVFKNSFDCISVLDRILEMKQGLLRSLRFRQCLVNWYSDGRFENNWEVIVQEVTHFLEFHGT